MVLFTKITDHLGVSDNELELCRTSFWRHFIFAGRPEKKHKNGRVHIRSGNARQWPDVFDRKMGEEFVRRFDDALVQLGHERDRSWLDSLPKGGPASLQNSIISSSGLELKTS
jgi:hypothetical protein